MSDKNTSRPKVIYGKAVTFWSVILIIVLFISTFVPWIFNMGENFPWLELLKSSIYMLGGIAVFIITMYFFNFQQLHKYRDAFKRRAVLNMIIVVFIVLFASLISMSVFLQTKEPWLKIIDDPGGIFTIIIGIITTLGFYLTVETLVDYKYKISSFNELIDNVCKLLEETPKNEKIKYLTATPLIGSLAVDDSAFERLEDLIHLNYKRIDMITLDDDTLKKYNNMFKGRQTRRGKGSLVDEELIKKVQQDCDDVISHLLNSNQAFNPIRLPDNKMPGYYIIATSRKAIIATPFFMPFPMNNFKHDELTKLPVVTMFGFVTKDPKIISDALLMFQKIETLK
jgi:hypothetical protein